MALNIVDMVNDHLGGDVAGAVGKVFGVAPDSVQRGMSAAVPSVLFGVTAKARTPEGARALGAAVDVQTPRLLGDLEGGLSGPDSALIANRGSETLRGLVGDGAMTSASGAIERFAGVPRGVAGKLLGVATPAVLGVIGELKRTQGLSDRGVAEMLEEQRGNIDRAMPAGFSPRSPAHAKAVAAVVEVPREPTARRVGAYTLPRGRGTPWVRWIVSIAVAMIVAGFAYKWVADRRVDDSAPTTGTVVESTDDSAREVRILLSDELTDIEGTLDRVDSAQSAQTMRAQLAAQAESLEATKQQLATMPDAARAEAASYMQETAPRVQTAIDRVRAIDGVDAALGKQLDAIQQDIDEIANW